MLCNWCTDVYIIRTYGYILRMASDFKSSNSDAMNNFNDLAWPICKKIKQKMKSYEVKAKEAMPGVSDSETLRVV